MKIVRKILLLASVFVVLMLTGCLGNIKPIAIDTVLTVDTSFKGDRVMTATIPASAFKYAFKGDADALEDVIGKYTPGDMYCTAVANEDGTATIEMHVDFASRNEYCNEINTICSGNTSEDAITPVVNFDYSRSILKNGYTIEENFTSLDLFYWLSDALIQEYPALQKKNIEDIFQLGSTVVVLDGERLEMIDRIQISNIVSNAFDHIMVTAQLNSDQSVNGEVIYTVGNKVVASLGTKLDTLMKGLVPEGANLTYKDSDSERVYSLTFDAATIEAYILCVNKALHASNTAFEVTTEGDAESLSATQSIRQYYDGSYFLDFTDENTYMTYVLKVASDYSMSNCTSTYGYLRDESATYSDDLCEVIMKVASSDEITAVLGFAVDINEVDVITEIHNNNHLYRTIQFKLTSDADSLIGKGIQEKLETAANTWDSEDKCITVSRENSVSTINYTVVLAASSPEELTELTVLVLGSSANDENSETIDSMIAGGMESRRNPWKMHRSYEDILNFSKFLKGSQIKNGIHYMMTYPAGYRAAFSETTVYEDAATNGGAITCSTYDKVLTVKSTAEKWNVEGIIILSIWILSLLLVILAAIMNWSNIYSLIKNRSLDLPGDTLFEGKNLQKMTIGVVAFVCFIIMSIRLIFRIY